jgi:DNA-binding NtrC family response regulator
MKESIISVPAKTMEMLVRWEWPGNTREPENFLERTVILTPGWVVRAPLLEFQAAVDQAGVGVGAACPGPGTRRILRAVEAITSGSSRGVSRLRLQFST